MNELITDCFFIGLGTDDDYEQWKAHSDNKNDGCLLGKKEFFQRLKPDAWYVDSRPVTHTHTHTFMRAQTCRVVLGICCYH